MVEHEFHHIKQFCIVKTQQFNLSISPANIFFHIHFLSQDKMIVPFCITATEGQRVTAKKKVTNIRIMSLLTYSDTYMSLSYLGIS